MEAIAPTLPSISGPYVRGFAFSPLSAASTVLSMSSVSPAPFTATVGTTGTPRSLLSSSG